jgi:hypothetical protein
VKMKTPLSGEKAKTPRKPKTTAPLSSSEDSEESSSSSDEDNDRTKHHAHVSVQKYVSVGCKIIRMITCGPSSVSIMFFIMHLMLPLIVKLFVLVGSFVTCLLFSSVPCFRVRVLV